MSSGLIGAVMGGLAGAGNAVATIGRTGMEAQYRLDTEQELSAMREEQQLRIEETLAKRKTARAQDAAAEIRGDVDARVANEQAVRNVGADETGPNWQPSSEDRARYGYEASIERGNADQATLYGGLIDRHMKDAAAERDERKIGIQERVVSNQERGNELREKRDEQRHEENMKRIELLEKRLNKGQSAAGATPAEVATAEWLQANAGNPAAMAAWEKMRTLKNKSREETIMDTAAAIMKDGMTPRAQALQEATQLYESVFGNKGDVGTNKPAFSGDLNQFFKP